MHVKEVFMNNTVEPSRKPRIKPNVNTQNMLFKIQSITLICGKIVTVGPKPWYTLYVVLTWRWNILDWICYVEYSRPCYEKDSFDQLDEK